MSELREAAARRGSFLQTLRAVAWSFFGVRRRANFEQDVQKLNPVAQVIHDNVLSVDHTGDEKTAVRFTLDEAGKVIDVNYRQKSLLETFRSVNRNGSELDPKTGYVKKL